MDGERERGSDGKGQAVGDERARGTSLIFWLSPHTLLYYSCFHTSHALAPLNESGPLESSAPKQKKRPMSGTLEEQAIARKARLNELRSRKRKAEGDIDVPAAEAQAQPQKFVPRFFLAFLVALAAHSLREQRHRPSIV